MKTQIQNDMKDAMRNKDVVTRDTLRVVLGEIDRNPNGTDVTKLIKKMVTNIQEMNGSEEEIKVLQKYLPQQLTRIQIEEIVDDIIVEQDLDGMKSMGIIMKHFSQTYPNLYDGKLVSTIIKEVLS